MRRALYSFAIMRIEIRIGVAVREKDDVTPRFPLGVRVDRHIREISLSEESFIERANPAYFDRGSLRCTRYENVGQNLPRAGPTRAGPLCHFVTTLVG